MRSSPETFAEEIHPSPPPAAPLRTSGRPEGRQRAVGDGSAPSTTGCVLDGGVDDCGLAQAKSEATTNKHWGRITTRRLSSLRRGLRLRSAHARHHFARVDATLGNLLAAQMRHRALEQHELFLL